MRFVAVEFHAAVHLAHFTVHSNVEVAFAPNCFKQLFVVSFTPLYDRRAIARFALVMFEYQLKNLLFAVFHHFRPFRTNKLRPLARTTDAKIVYFGGGASWLNADFCLWFSALLQLRD